MCNIHIFYEYIKIVCIVPVYLLATLCRNKSANFVCDAIQCKTIKNLHFQTKYTISIISARMKVKFWKKCGVCVCLFNKKFNDYPYIQFMSTKCTFSPHSCTIVFTNQNHYYLAVKINTTGIHTIKCIPTHIHTHTDIT